MSVELKVPPVGESITEVVIGEWLKAEGDSVELDEVIAKIETDKVTVDLPSPVAGRLLTILLAKGSTAAVGDVIGLLEESSPGAVAVRPVARREASQSTAKSASQPAPTAQRPAAIPSEPRPHPVTSGAVDPTSGIEPRGTASTLAAARVMPSARRALHQHGLDAEGIAGSGAGARILKEDVLRTAEAQRKRPLGLAPGQTAVEAAERFEDIVPMSPFRRRIAERLVDGQHNAALLTTFNEVDMSAVLALRKEYQDEFHEKYGIKLGFMSFFVKATVEALKLIPAVNAEIRGSDIVYKNFYDIGIAVGGGKGLVVPVVRGADRMSFAELEQTIFDLGKRAKENKIELHELAGGTFTISNGGVYGSLLSTPIVNPPQSGILGLHAMQDRPIAANGQVVIRPMMYIALTYDHRLIDGREAVTFLKRIKQCVEQPTRILLEI